MRSLCESSDTIMIITYLLVIFISTGLVTMVTGQLPGDCVCFYGASATSRISVRRTACGVKLSTTRPGQCYRATGNKKTCILNGRRCDFWQYLYNTRTAWSASDYLRVTCDTRCDSSNPPTLSVNPPAPPVNPAPSTPGGCNQLTIIARNSWGARNPRSRSRIPNSVSKYFIHHSVGPPCTTTTACKRLVRGIQNYHMNTKRWSDIGYSFLVGEDGRVYEGRGWGMAGGHTLGYNTQSYGICILGDFTNRLPNQAALEAVQDLMACGVSKGKVSSNYKVYGHKDGRCTNTACPGNTLYAKMKTWSRYGGQLRCPRRD